MRILRPQPLIGRPRISVVIPCYNYGHYLPDAVNSALQQEGVDVDVLIVDDASPDGSIQVARRLAAGDSRVRVLAHEQNKGHLATYNDGLLEVDGTYVVLLSADDLLAPGSLARSAALLESRPDVTFVYGWAADFHDKPPPLPTSKRLNWSVWKGEDWIASVCRRGHNVITNPEVVMRRQTVLDAGLYDLRQPHTADMYLWLRAATMGNVGRVNGPHQAYYRVHQGNMHVTDFGGTLTDIRHKHAMFDYFADAVDSERGQKWRELAEQSTARQALRTACSGSDGSRAMTEYTMAEFAEFAVTTWSGIKSTALWKSYQRNFNGSNTHLRRWLFSLDYSTRNRLRWRRLRRYGI